MRELTLTFFVPAALRADLPASPKGLVRLTQARAALSELDRRIGEYSWPLTLPDTRQNARIFGVDALHPLAVDKFRATDFAYELRCESEIFTGTFRLTSLRGGYTGQLLGAGFAWALALADKKLPDLRFAEVAYDGTQLAAILAQDCDQTDLQFPLCSFGNFYAPPLRVRQPDNTLEDAPNPPAAVLDFPLAVDDYPPGVYYRNVLRQIFQEIGWGLSGKVLDEAQWRQTVLTCAGADPEAAWPWGALLPASASGPGSSQFSYFDAGPTSGGDRYTNSAVGFADDPRGEIFFLPVACPALTSGGTRALHGAPATYTAPRAGTYAFSWSAALASSSQTLTQSDPNAVISTAERAGLAAVGLGLVVRRGGEGLSGGDGGLCATGQLAAGQDRVVGPLARLDPGTGLFQLAASGSYSGQAAGVYLEPGDTVQLAAFARRRLLDAEGGQDFVRSVFVLNFGATAFACTAYADNAGVSRTTVQPSAFLPPLSQKEVVKDFLKRTDTVPYADANRRVVYLLSRAELSAAAGEPLDLTDLCDPAQLEYTPTCGPGVGVLVFTGPDVQDPLLAAGSDTVRVAIGPGPGEQTVASLYAPAAFRSYRLRNGLLAEVPTFADAAALETPRDETAWDVKSQAPRLVRYTGPHATLTIPFGTGTLPLATAAWDGALAWGGATGAVNTYYAATLLRARRGHVAKGAVNLTPALYRDLQPGRRVVLAGAAYQLEAVNQYDLADDANQTSVELLRDL